MEQKFDWERHVRERDIENKESAIRTGYTVDELLLKTKKEAVEVSQGGFTLLELLIVIVIGGILLCGVVAGLAYLFIKALTP